MRMNSFHPCKISPQCRWYLTEVGYDILINELQVTSYDLISLRVAFIAMSYDLLLLHELRVTFFIQVTSCCLHTTYFLHTSYKLLFIPWVKSHHYCTSYELLFTARVTSYCLLHELRVTFCIWVTSYCLLHESRVIF